MLGLIRRIGIDFGVSVLVTSHLLGELERIADHVVIIDAGRLLRASSTAEFTRATQTLAVEVSDLGDGAARDRVAERLTGAGLQVRHDGALLEIDIVDDTTFDLVRDATAELGAGLVRMQQRRHRMEDVFRDVEAPEDPRVDAV
jgi:ABC-2 type transport system ATP-binding protein